MITTKKPSNKTNKVIVLPTEKSIETGMIQLAGKHLTFVIDLQQLISTAEPVDLAQYEIDNVMAETENNNDNCLLLYINLTPKKT